VHAPPILLSFGFPQEIAAQPPIVLACFFYSMIVMPLELVAGIGMNAIRRNFVWQTDRFAAELQYKLNDEKMSDMGDRLGRALITMYVKNFAVVWVDWLYVFPADFL
jgi:STE24 endopeptidase